LMLGLLDCAALRLVQPTCYALIPPSQPSPASGGRCFEFFFAASRETQTKWAGLKPAL
jgi:hypothetical protein